MTMERFPADLVITTEDFNACGLQEALATSDRDGYFSMHTALSEAARKAIEDGRTAQGKVLWLLSDASSMMLKPKQPSEPFAPFIVMNGRRSAIPDDFTEADLDFFAQIVDGIEDVWLRGRVADVLWVRRRQLGAAIALTAIDAYRAIPLDHDTWIRDGEECWKRALLLTRMLKKAAGDRLQEMEATILEAFEKANSENGYLGLWTASLLEENHLGWAHAAAIATKLEELALDFESKRDLHRARDFFEGSRRWYGRSKNEMKAVEMTVKLAETWVESAEERLASGDPSHMVAAGFYENAIQVYRTIPRRNRETHRVNERMEELRLLMRDSGEQSLDEMKPFASGSIDITEIVEAACEAIRGKDLIQALLAFVNHTRSVNVDQLRKSAEKAIRQFPIQSLFGTTHVASDGRVIARSSGSGEDPTESEEQRDAVWSQMIRHYLVNLGLTVQGLILPGLEILILEHRLNQEDFITIAKHSPIVPPGRERLFGMALHAGFEANFGVAIHLLTPQIENLVRFHLKNAGVKTTNLDQQGIENEIGLSSLMDLPEVETIFGKDLVFELKVLFCDAIGPNLRNETAHGLLDDSVCQSEQAVYAWWLGLKLALNTFWNRARCQPTKLLTPLSDKTPDPLETRQAGGGRA